MVRYILSVKIEFANNIIVGYYQNYARVRQTFRLMATTVLVICCVAFMIFQLFPNFIVSSFGSGDALYVSFAVRPLRIYMFFTFLNGLQPIIANVFTSIGKATKGIAVAITRQILFLLPAIIVLPIFFGIDGVAYAGLIADLVAFVFAIYMILNKFRHMPKENQPITAKEVIA